MESDDMQYTVIGNGDGGPVKVIIERPQSHKLNGVTHVNNTIAHNFTMTSQQRSGQQTRSMHYMQRSDTREADNTSHQHSSSPAHSNGSTYKLTTVNHAAPPAPASVAAPPPAPASVAAPPPAPASAAVAPPRPRTLEHLKNLLDNSTHSDVLHRKGEGLGCHSACKGSMLAQPQGRKFSVERPRGEILNHMTDFMRQYYESNKSLNSTQHKARVSEAQQQIEMRGTYQLTYEELSWGAKMGWRNSSRCIGRIQWNNLQVFDCRHVRTAREMFDALCRHMEYATNGGNIRSAITIFPQRRHPGYHDFRVWNPFLIRYAGYRLPDGSVLGDPASLEFTQVCIKHGWKPPERRTAFDLLPWMLQADGQEPELFDSPPELSLQVDIVHPKYSWFKDLGLKWYAVPVVSSMMLDCGGLEFTGCPFNGWYMGSEIGARNFCDKTRYNKLETIAKKLGLDTTSTSTLWKDKACIEMNVAVLHSYQRNGVTIIDHHSASDSFMKHLATEQRTRGGCPADWVWIVPPISGSLCPVFHQEMLNYKLYPSYEYQRDPWVDYAKSKMSADLRKGPQLTLKIVATAAFICNRLMEKVLARRKRCTIMFATETGRSEGFAKQLGTIFSHIFNTKVICMEDYDFAELQTEELILVVASTFVNGDPPENGKSFVKILKSLKTSEPHNFRYSVFALGSRAYPNFCAFGYYVDKLLCGLAGSGRVMAVGVGDEMCEQEDSFHEWAVQVFKQSCEDFNVSDAAAMKAATSSFSSYDTSWQEGKYRLQRVDEEDLPLCQALSLLHKRKVVLSKVKSNKNLQSSKSSRKTILLKLNTHTHEDSLRYEPGDHLGIFPVNDGHVVKSILNRLHDSVTSSGVTHHHQTYQLQTLHETKTGKTYWADHSKFPVFSLKRALTNYLDITSTPTQKLLGLMASFTADNVEQENLEALSKNKGLYEEWKARHCPGLADALDQFPSVRLSTSFLITQLPLLQYRLYSISSAPAMYQAEIHATVAVVKYHTKEGSHIKHGLCSNWISRLSAGQEVPCFTRASVNFHLPEDVSRPVIMIGPGTGVAPFRAFWQHRQQQRKAWKNKIDFGSFTLYFGCRRGDHDHIYKIETKKLQEKRILTKSYTAYSREPKKEKTYVQDLLRAHAASVYEVMTSLYGHVFVCGDAFMSGDVMDTLQDVIAKHGNISQQQAKEMITTMKEENRYHEDIFNILRNT